MLPFLSVAGTSTLLHSVAETSRPSDERNVSGFHAVSSSGSFEVHITMGSSEKLRIEGDEDQLSRIETKVENGILKIGYKRQAGLQRSATRAKVYITAKSVDALTLSGSGNIEVEGDIRGESLNTKVSGSGSITFSAVVSHLTAAISGSGDLTASGSADDCELSISGSGEFSGKNFKTKKAGVKVSGSGSVNLHVANELNAVIRGSGNVHYSGDPVVRQDRSGSGKVSKN